MIKVATVTLLNKKNTHDGVDPSTRTRTLTGFQQRTLLPCLHFSVWPWHNKHSFLSLWQLAQMVKRLSTMWETRVQSRGWEDPVEKEMAIYSSTVAWKIPWTEEPGRLQSMGSQRVRHDCATSLSLFSHYVPLQTLYHYGFRGGEGRANVTLGRRMRSSIHRGSREVIHLIPRLEIILLFHASRFAY